jgi:hypothetical protein
VDVNLAVNRGGRIASLFRRKGTPFAMSQMVISPTGDERRGQIYPPDLDACCFMNAHCTSKSEVEPRPLPLQHQCYNQ